MGKNRKKGDARITQVPDDVLGQFDVAKPGTIAEV